MKTLKKTLSLTLVFALVFSLMSFAFAAETTTTSTTTTGYKDAADITYKEAVDVTSAIGVFQGNDLGAFAPKDNLTREQAAKIICYLTMGKAAADKLTTSSAPFADVAADRWSAGSIAYCVQQGIVAGYGNGNFGPTDTVTGYQFAKMLLVCLGYDAAIEGFTGNDWQINVAKRAFQNKLSEGNDAFVGTAAATREEAALYTKNTLLAQTVTYANKGTEIKLPDGTTVRQGASAPTQGATFMASYYSTLKVNTGDTRDYLGTGTDDFGRASNNWTYKGVAIGKYAAEASITYTADMRSTSGKAAVAKALKGYTISSVPVTVNNKANGNVSTTDAIAALTGNGTRVDVYATNNTVTKVVVVKEVLAKVTYVNTKAETISLLTLVDGNYGTSAVSLTTSLGYGKVAAGDYVVIATKDEGTANVIAGDTVVADLTTVTTVTGKATTKSTTDGTITVNGKVYKEAASVVTNNAVSDFAISAKNDATLILDSNGYIMLAKSGAATYGDNLFALTKIYSTLKDGVIVNMVKGYDSTGTLIDLPLENGINAGDEGKVFSYVDSDNNGAYEFTAIADASTLTSTPASAANHYNFTLKDSSAVPATAKTATATFTGGSATFYFASNVKFIFADDANNRATVVNGVQAINANTLATYVLSPSGTNEIIAVFAQQAPTSTANTASDLVFLAKVDTNAVIGKDGKVYDSYTAVQNGMPVADCYGTHNALTANDCGKFYTVSKDDTTGVSTFTAYTESGAVTPLFVKEMAPVVATNTAGTIVTALKAGGNVTLDIGSATIINLDTKAVGSAAEIASALTAKQQGASTTAPYIAAIYNEKGVASVVYYTAKSMATVASGYTATGSTLAKNGVTVTGVTANKTHAIIGDTITYTVTYDIATGGATAATTITLATTGAAGAPANIANGAAAVTGATTTVTMTVTSATATAINAPVVTVA